MKLARIGSPGAERPAVLDEDGVLARPHRGRRRRDGRSARRAACLDRVRQALDAGDLPALPQGQRFGPPVAGIGKIVCIGLNYRDHAAETGAQVPTEPVLFMKAPDTVVGPDDDGARASTQSRRPTGRSSSPSSSGGTRAYLDTPEQAAEHIAGYAISHDVSEREFQIERGGQWDKGKNCATFNPFGPWLVTAGRGGRPPGPRPALVGQR